MTPRRVIFYRVSGRLERTGFTLIELIIVVAILLILATLTLAIFNSTNESDRIRSSARQLQSALLGARDRAIRAKEARGLRLLRDPATNTISSMVYIGSPEIWREGTIAIGREDFSPADQTPDNGSVTIVRGWNTDWQLLFQQGLLTNGARIKIPADSTGSWYTVDTIFLASAPSYPMSYPSPADDILVLTGSGFRTPAIYTGVNAFDPMQPNIDGVGNYLLELQPAILPGQEPLKLSSGIVIDVTHSKLPTLSASNSLDIVFSPRGLVASGDVLASGLLHFYLCTQEDAIMNLNAADVTRNAADPNSGEKLILTLFPQTGNLATFPVNAVDGNGNQLADDPFSFAKTGGTAGR